MSKPRISEHMMRRGGTAKRRTEPTNPYLDVFDPEGDEPDGLSIGRTTKLVTSDDEGHTMTVHGRCGSHPSMHYPGDQRNDADYPNVWAERVRRKLGELKKPLDVEQEVA